MMMKRRTKIRIASFSLALLTALLAWGIWGSVRVYKLKLEKNAVQQQALMQVTEYLDKIETTLKKASYAGSAGMLGSLSSDLHGQALGAKTGLAALSAGDNTLYNTYKFLSQVGEYTATLSKKAEKGESISEEERQTLSRLLDLSGGLYRQFSYMAELLDAGYFSFEEIKAGLIDLDKASEDMVSFLSAASDAEESMDDYPTLIYDGPFSDHIMTKTSALLEKAETISRETAASIGAKALSVKENALIYDGDADGKIPTYSFYTDATRVAVTKNGGYIAYILSDYTAGSEKLTDEDAVKRASAFLTRCGYTQMQSTYSAVNDGVCVVNFAYTLGSYTAYPDLIKVGVSLTDGRIVSMDARDYIMNHTPRSIPEPALSVEEAGSVVNESLTVKETDFALIPTPGGDERFTYEFLCTDENGQDVLVYVNTVTGEEEDILILLYSDGGTLTK